VITGLNIGPPVTALDPNWGIWSAADTTLHQLSKISEVSCQLQKRALTIVTWSGHLKIRCHVIVKQQRATADICARKFRNVCVCRRKSGHEWSANSSLHHTRALKLALAQC